MRVLSPNDQRLGAMRSLKSERFVFDSVSRSYVAGKGQVHSVLLP